MINKKEREPFNVKTYHLHKHSNQMEYLTFPGFEQFNNLSHLFSTRNGGISTGCYESLNFAFREEDLKSNVHHHYQQLAEILGTNEDHLITSAQTHTANIRIVTRADCGKGLTKEKDFSDIDGLITNETEIGIITAHADCNAIFFYDPVEKVIGLAHSGWSGTLENIVAAMIKLMKEQFKCLPQNIHVGIGPSLCQNCFEVDFDVSNQFMKACALYEPYIQISQSKAYIDLREIIHLQLDQTGILQTKISQMDLCTKCHPELFYSHRRQGIHRGVMVAAMILHESDTADI